MDKVLLFRQKDHKIIPQRLREAREACELTMEQLGDLVGVKRQTISNYESGIRSPEPEILMKLVEALRQPLIFFTTERPNNFGLRETTFFRSFRSKTTRTNKRCDRQSTWFVEIAAYFGRFVNYPTVELPEIAPPVDKKHYTAEEIEQAAQECRKHWGLGNGPISNMVALLESKGIIVARSEFGADTISAFSFWEGGRPFIFLGADRATLCRTRFSAAHELGHLLLHRGVSEEELEADLKLFEKEADLFASAFLLPEETYPLEVFALRPLAFIELKRRWKVSAGAQIHRCLDLGIITDEQFLGLRKQLSKNRWLKEEPLDNTLPIEKPKIMEKSLTLLLEHGVQDTERLLSNIRLSKATIDILLDINLPENNPTPNPTSNLRLISK